MSRVLIFGNSGSGKSTLAKHLCKTQGLAHLDLDTLAWKPTLPTMREAIEKSGQGINAFIDKNSHWVIEGCYSDLLVLLQDKATEIIYMNLPVSLCVENAKNRPWEPHKYKSKQAQDDNLPMLINWIEAYQSRVDTFSASSHLKFYRDFKGDKRMITINQSFGKE